MFEKNPAADALEAEVSRALAELQTSRERVYSDADADDSAREAYYRATDPTGRKLLGSRLAETPSSTSLMGGASLMLVMVAPI